MGIAFSRERMKRDKARKREAELDLNSELRDPTALRSLIAAGAREQGPAGCLKKQKVLSHFRLLSLPKEEKRDVWQ